MPNLKFCRFAKIIFINTLIIVGIFIAAEYFVRLFLYFSRGSSNVGMPERRLYLVYRPFIMFGPDYDTRIKSFYDNKQIKRQCRILLVGGSTAQLFPAEILKKVFEEKFSDYDFEVINLAYGGYNARQEAIVMAIWGVNANPDIVISLDGANDLIHRLRMQRAGSFYLDSAYNTIFRYPFFSPALHIMRNSQLINGIQRLQERRNIGPADNYLDAIPFYVSAQHSINIMAKGLGALRIMVLQPFNAFKEPLSEDEANFKHYKYREAIIKELYNKLAVRMEILAAEDNVLYIDSRPIFNGLKEAIFSDDVHFVDDKGYEILARNIADFVAKEDLRMFH